MFRKYYLSLFRKQDMAANIELEPPVTSRTCDLCEIPAEEQHSKKKDQLHNFSIYEINEMTPIWVWIHLFFIQRQQAHFYITHITQAEPCATQHQWYKMWIGLAEEKLRDLYDLKKKKIQVDICIFYQKSAPTAEHTCSVQVFNHFSRCRAWKISKPIENGHTAAHLRIKRFANENI